MRVRLVATDLDGTALREGLDVSPRVAAAIEAVRRAGVVVVFVTARNWRSVEVIAASAGVGGLAVCSNGSVIYDLDGREVLASHHMDHATLMRFMDDCRAADAEVGFAWETPHDAFREESFPVRCPPLSPVYVRSLLVATRPKPEDRVTKVMVGHPMHTAEELLRRLAPLTEGSLTASISGPHFLEICAAGVSKAVALGTLCETLRVGADEVVAVGDHLNDLPMLLWAGRGVAMGNSHPDVLEAISEHMASNLDDGLALVLEGLIAAGAA